MKGKLFDAPLGFTTSLKQNLSSLPNYFRLFLAQLGKDVNIILLWEKSIMIFIILIKKKMPTLYLWWANRESLRLAINNNFLFDIT